MSRSAIGVALLLVTAACGSEEVRPIPTLDGVDPVTFGMTQSFAYRALDARRMTHDTAGPGCSYMTAQMGGKAFRFMFNNGSVVRVDVTDSTVASQTGARIGLTEDSVQTLYGRALRVLPHKYTQGGHYLIYVEPSDSLRRMVFETDGRRVTMWRTGVFPYVEYVEGCS